MSRALDHRHPTGELRVRDLPRVDVDFAEQLVDFDTAGGGKGSPSDGGPTGFGRSQLEGAVAAFNMLATNRVAYLADEVGLGKTYVALGVAGLLRHLQPNARVMILAPRENIQRKWIKELTNFTRRNWRVADNRVRSVDGRPARRPVRVDGLADLVHELSVGDRRDLFLRMTSFSITSKSAEARRAHRLRLTRELPWLPRGSFDGRTADRFIHQVGLALNAAMPPVDLLIVDEAHNLRHGFGPRAATRNRLIGLACGHPDGGEARAWWYGPRIARVLCLSATPFEGDLAGLYRQLDLFGLGSVRLAGADGVRDRGLEDLARTDTTEAEAKEVASRFMLRRVGFLQAGGERLTKNLYRREWRRGGYQDPATPMRAAGDRERLVVGLVQSKVARILGADRFGARFQVGMLSSFESFLESVGRRAKRAAEAEEEATFDGAEQTDDARERRGVDSDALAAIAEGYRERFGHSLPHPKLDATAEALESAFHTGEKALVFVRRVATTHELAAKLARRFDIRMEARLRTALPHLDEELSGIWRRYRDEGRAEELDHEAEEAFDGLEGAEAVRSPGAIDEDELGTGDFFSWFFRGKGPSGVLSGAAFRKNRIDNASSAYSTLFEEDYVARLLDRPDDVVAAWVDAIGDDAASALARLRARAFAHLRRATRRKSFPRFFVLESYQAAALGMLSECTGEVSRMAEVWLHERFPDHGFEEEDPPETFPGPEAGLGVVTIPTEIARRTELRAELLPEASSGDARADFRRSEQRREMFSAQARLGAAYVDLWILAVRPLDSLALGQSAEQGSRPDVALARDYVALLESQRGQAGMTAFAELSAAASAFDTLLQVNFPEVESADLRTLATDFATALQHQKPVAAVAGGVNRRLVRQFRMPGFPLVLVSTDVLQEGEDLHTFCRRVIHYGVAWTSSGMEQRTGRVDRIGGLAQREIDGNDDAPTPEQKIQVQYPYLEETVEALQVRRVLRRLDRFVSLMHENLGLREEEDTRIDTARELLADHDLPMPPTGQLESAFPVRGEWLTAVATDRPGIVALDIDALEQHLERLWNEVAGMLPMRTNPTRDRGRRSGELLFLHGELVAPDQGDPATRHQHFRLELRSRAAGDSTLIHCESVVGSIELGRDALVDDLEAIQRELGARVCAAPENRHGRHRVSVEKSLLFHPETSSADELVRLIREVTLHADLIEERLLACDADDAEYEDVQ